jgi:molecular chaperone GrpE
MTLRALADALERHGVKIVEALGRQFDPAHHEAIGQVESEHPPNTVVDEHQRGYLLHDRLLRPALVTVGKPPAGSGER